MLLTVLMWTVGVAFLLTILNKSIKDIFDFVAEDIKLQDYNYHPAISLEVAV